MIARLGISMTSGLVVTFALLWLMQFLIATGKDALTDANEFRMPDFIRVRHQETIEQKDRKPPKPPKVEKKPPEMPPPDLDSMDPNAPTVNRARSSKSTSIKKAHRSPSKPGRALRRPPETLASNFTRSGC